MDISIININSKNKIPIYKNLINSNYSFGGTKGSAFLKFNIKEAGNYELTTNTKINNSSKIIISITQGFASKIIFTVLGSLVIMFGAILTSAFIIIGKISRGKN